MKRAGAAPPVEFLDMQELVDRPVAMRFVRWQEVSTEKYGARRVAVADIATLDGGVLEQKYVFWSSVGKQVEEGGGEWIAGVLRSEPLDVEGYRRYVLDASILGETEFAALQNIVG